MKKPAIPSQAGPQFNKAIKENIESITGVRGEKIKKLESNASLSDVITKINEILTLLQ